MHIASIHMVNARSFGACTLKLHPGLNVVIGDSDSGKSNLVRNIVSVLENDSAEAMYRTGMDHTKDFTDVRLAFTGGDFVGLHKELASKANQFAIQVDGKGSKWSQVGQSVPDDVRRFVNMGPVVLGGEPVRLNVSMQRGPVFGVDDPPARLARIVGAVSGLDVVVRAQRRAEKELRAATAKQKAEHALFTEVRETYRQKARRVDIPAMGALLESACESRSRAGSVLEEQEHMQGAIDHLLDSSRRYKHARDKAATGMAAAEGLGGCTGRAEKAVAAWGQMLSALNGLMGAARQHSENLNLITEAQADAESAQAELDTFQESHGVCPACGRLK